LKLLFALSVVLSTALAGEPGEYHLGPGDVVNVKVHGHDFGRTEFVVGATGEISFPYVGLVDIGDSTAVEAERVLADKLRDGYLVNPQVTVQVSKFKSQQVEVLGAIKKPGLYYLEGPTTARSLVAMAGGVDGEQAGDVLIKRDGETIRIELGDLNGMGGDFSIRPGDVLTIDSSSNVVYLAGEVKKAGAISYSEGMTVSQALIQAGGDSGLGRLSGSYVLRGDERIAVNLRRIMKGKDADLMLQPGDKVVIPVSAL